MYRINIPFKDYFGNDHEKEYMFQLTQSEMLQFEAETDNGLRKTLEALSEGREPNDLVAFFSMMVKASYGEISDDGMIFDKSEDVWNRFYRSPAYDQFFMKLVTTDSTAINFLNGILPGPTE